MPSPQAPTLGLRARASTRLRCVFCHDALTDEPVVCARCGAVAHAECTSDSRRCSTLACSGELARPRLAWLRSRLATLVAIGLVSSPLAVGGVVLWLKWSDSRVVAHGPLLRWVDNSGRSLVTTVDTSRWSFEVLLDRRHVRACDEKGQTRWIVDVIAAYEATNGVYACRFDFGDDELVPECRRLAYSDAPDQVFVPIGHGGIGLDCATGRYTGLWAGRALSRPEPGPEGELVGK